MNLKCASSNSLTLLHYERPKLHRVLAFLSAIGFKHSYMVCVHVNDFDYSCKDVKAIAIVHFQTNFKSTSAIGPTWKLHD